MVMSHEEILARLAVAVFLGGLIGYEREIRSHPAGLRTHLLVALASATFALVSFHAAGYQNYQPNAMIRFDVGRIASNIVVGIGFLGGGAIVHSGLNIKGLTTAASLWLVAAIGLAGGCGMYLLAVAVTLIALLTLSLLWVWVEVPHTKIHRFLVILEIQGSFLTREQIAEHLLPVEARVKRIDYRRDFLQGSSRMDLHLTVPHDGSEQALLSRLEQLPSLRRIVMRRRG